MLSSEDIQKYGGKAAILNHIREKLPDMPIPSYLIKEVGSSLDSISPKFQKTKKPVIVRSSSPYEYGNFEGIFDSVRDIHNNYDLEKAIEQVEESATSERAKEYAKQHGFQIDDDIHVIIQEQSDSKYCGAMIRHPNNPDIIFISYFFGWKKYDRDYSRFLFDENTQSSGDNRVFMSSSEFDEDDAKFLVEKYKQIEGLRDIADGYSLFVEFGHKPFYVYQARPFKKIETANFQLPKFDYDKDLWSDFVFGITPPEGIVLPVIKTIGFKEALPLALKPDNEIMESGFLKEHDVPLNLFLMEGKMVFKMEGEQQMIKHINHRLKWWLKDNEEIGHYRPYCLMTTSAHGEEYDIDLNVPNMKALVLGRAKNFLVHNLMRLFKKADVTVGSPLLQFNDFYKNAVSHDDRVRIISNGKEGIVVKE